MIEIGSFRSRDCHGITRRSFVQAATSVPLALGLGGLATRDARAWTPTEGRARSVLMVWLWGGPAQHDTFDPKPDAPGAIRGPFATIKTKSGDLFSELLPRLARCSDKFAVVRSTKFAANHDMRPLAGGRRRGRGEEPNFGSIVARRKTIVGLPSFVSVAPLTSYGHGFQSTTVPGHGAGRLGSAYNPFIVRCSSEGKLDIAGLRLLDGLSPERLDDRNLLRQQLGDLGRKLEKLEVEQWNRQLEGAYSLLGSGGASRAFDLSRESEDARGAYGRTPFGQSMLLGRRLVEAGVPYVQVNWSLGVDGLEEGSSMGWDTHRNGFGQLMNYHCPIFDRAFSALLEDLSVRGLLDSTLVVAMGEMGRTPKINKTGGRDHWATCSTLWAGAGVQGGRIVGETDANGAEPVSRPITPLMVGTTIAEAAGLDAQARVELGVLDGGQVVHELF